MLAKEKTSGCSAVVARFVRDEEVVGSNPATPTTNKSIIRSIMDCLQKPNSLMLLTTWVRGDSLYPGSSAEAVGGLKSYRVPLAR